MVLLVRWEGVPNPAEMLVELWPAPKASKALSSLFGNPARPNVLRIVCILDLLPVNILWAYACNFQFAPNICQYLFTPMLQTTIKNPSFTHTPDDPHPKLSCPLAHWIHGEVPPSALPRPDSNSGAPLFSILCILFLLEPHPTILEAPVRKDRWGLKMNVIGRKNCCYSIVPGWRDFSYDWDSWWCREWEWLACLPWSWEPSPVYSLLFPLLCFFRPLIAPHQMWHHGYNKPLRSTVNQIKHKIMSPTLT